MRTKSNVIAICAIILFCWSAASTAADFHFGIIDAIKDRIDRLEDINNPPYIPSNPSPTNGATDQSIDIGLVWNGGDPDSGDIVTYDVYFEANDSSPDELISNDQSGTSYDLAILSYEAHYYWQVVATDNHGASTSGPVWSFTTREEEVPPPSAPSNLTGQAVSFSEINLSWQDNSDNEDGFKIFRSFGGVNYEEILDLGPNTTSSNVYQYSNTTYWYYVSAYNSSGSAASDSIQVTTPAEPPEVEILDYHMEEEYLGYDWCEWKTIIVGNVRNNTDRTLTIWIQGKFFDQNGVMVRTSWDLLDPVGASETWRFEINYWNEIGERISRVEAWVDDYY